MSKGQEILVLVIFLVATLGVYLAGCLLGRWLDNTRSKRPGPPAVEGLNLPVLCGWCREMGKEVGGYWNAARGTEIKSRPGPISHGMCPGCAEKFAAEFTEGNKGIGFQT